MKSPHKPLPSSDNVLQEHTTGPSSSSWARTRTRSTSSSSSSSELRVDETNLVAAAPDIIIPLFWPHGALPSVVIDVPPGQMNEMMVDSSSYCTRRVCPHCVIESVFLIISDEGANERELDERPSGVTSTNKDDGCGQ